MGAMPIEAQIRNCSRFRHDAYRGRRTAHVLQRRPHSAWPGDPLMNSTRELDSELQRQLRTVSWGLLPAWAKDWRMASKLINARSETVTENSSFRSGAVKRRAIVPANGYYEWMKSQAGANFPYSLRGGDDNLAVAELYELWPDPELPEDDPNKWVWTCTVLTRPATDSTGHIRDRSPLILPESFWEHWRGPDLTDKGEVQAMINSVPEPHLEPYEVSTAVNSPRNNDPSLLEPVH